MNNYDTNNDDYDNNNNSNNKNDNIIITNKGKLSLCHSKALELSKCHSKIYFYSNVTLKPF
jgi:hypothetical protein